MYVYMRLYVHVHVHERGKYMEMVINMDMDMDVDMETRTVKIFRTPCCIQRTKTKDSYLHQKSRSAENRWRSGDQGTARKLKNPEPKFFNIQWRLKSRLFKGHSVQQGSQWLPFFRVDCKVYFV